MTDPCKPAAARTDKTTAPPPGQIWTGTGLCPEAQADGVPCQGTDGECERCGRAIPRRRQAD
jgi:hypothetical protein